MFKVATWNVNSVNSRLSRLQKFLIREKPDVLCLQELKCLEEKFPLSVIHETGYHAAIAGQKTYNGVALLTREPVVEVQKGFADGVDDPAARFIIGKCGGIYVASVYVPNGQSVGAPAYEYKLQWLGRLKRWLEKNIPSDAPLIVAGDYNVAPDPIDVHSPAEWEGQVLFSLPERKALEDLKSVSHQLVDTFRLHHTEGGLYSWWDYRALGFPFNKGLRIDLVLASLALSKKCVGSRIDREERKGEKPSDHAPVIAEFKL